MEKKDMNKDDIEDKLLIKKDARVIIKAVFFGIIVNFFTAGPILNTLDLGTIIAIAIVSKHIMNKIDNIKK